MIPKSAKPEPAQVLRKLALYAGILLVALYLLAIGGGYAWLRYVRKNEEVRLLDVALIRLGAIRRGIAAQHFANARKEWDSKNYQAAYLFFFAAVRQDPRNVTGRLSAVQFLRSVGAGNLGLVMLEEGLALAPDERRLIEPTFELLLTTGRDRHALDLLKQRYGAERAGKNGILLQRYELAATLTADGAPAAKSLLDRYAGLRQDPAATPIIARVLWESSDRAQAIDLLQAYLKTQPAVFADFSLLARWQAANGQAPVAAQTARLACEKFPHEIPARVLLIEMLLGEHQDAVAGPQAITAYFKDFSSQPEALLALAELAGRKGWVELNRMLYQLGANQQLDLTGLALAYADSLTRMGRHKEVAQILLQLEAQASEGNAPFMVQLRQRQVIAAAALGDSDSVHEYARRLAAAMRQDPDGLDVCRRLFSRLGIPEAVSELTGRTGKPAPVPAVKKNTTASK